MSSTLSHISESGKLFIKKKTSLTETVIELFSTLRFSVHETRTNKQQTYCAEADPGEGLRGLQPLFEQHFFLLFWLILPKNNRIKFVFTKLFHFHHTIGVKGYYNSVQPPFQKFLDPPLLCKQFTTRRWRGSFSISSEKGKIMERFSCKELLEKRWRDPRDDPCLMYKPAEKLQ